MSMRRTLLHFCVDERRAVANFQLEHDMSDAIGIASQGHTRDLRSRVYSKSNWLNFAANAMLQSNREWRVANDDGSPLLE